MHNYALLDTGLNCSDHCAVCFSARRFNSIYGSSLICNSNSCSKYASTSMLSNIINVTLLIIKTLLLKIYILYKVVLMILIVAFHVNTVSIRLHCLHLVIIWHHVQRSQLKIMLKLSLQVLKSIIDHLSSDLKRFSIETNAIWEAKGRPKSGFTNYDRLMCKYGYKRAIRVACNNFEKNLRNKLAD